MEVERNPSPPQLNQKAIRLITELCFRENDTSQKVDGIFVYSTIVDIAKLAKLIENIVSKEISDKIFITGNITPRESAKELGINTGLTEADALLQALNLDQYKNLNIFVERKSTNTLENVTKTLENPEFGKCKSLLFIFKSHAAGRGYLTLRKFFKSAVILQQTFDTKYNGASQEITRDNWHSFDFERNRVWGEFLRIKTYGSKGDIEYNNEVKNLVRNIEKEILE